MPLPQGKVSFNKDTISKMAAKERPAEGYFAFRITEAQPHEPKNADNFDIMSRLTTRMLKDPSDVDSVVGRSVSVWNTWPLGNPDDPDHEPPRWAADQTCSLLHALHPDEVPDVPRMIDKKMVYKGEEIDPDDEVACREEAIAAAGPYAAKYYSEHAELVGHVFFAQLYYSKKSPDFPSLRIMSAQAEQELSDTYVELVGGTNGAGPVTRKAAAKSRGSKGSRSKGGKGSSSRRKRV